MDIRVLEMATNLTIKAMGAENSGANWIGSEDKISAFLKTMASTLSTLSSQRSKDEDE
jgi:hypothetical protein